MVQYTYFFLLHRIPLSIYYAHGKKENTTPEFHDCRAPEYPRMRNSYCSRSSHVSLHQGDIYYWPIFRYRWWKTLLTRMVSLDIFSDYYRTWHHDSHKKSIMVINTFYWTSGVLHCDYVPYRIIPRWSNWFFRSPWTYGDIPREICCHTHTPRSLLRESLYDTQNLL